MNTRLSLSFSLSLCLCLCLSLSLSLSHTHTLSLFLSLPPSPSPSHKGVATKHGLLQPARPLGSYSIHAWDIPHQVTPLSRGARYSLRACVCYASRECIASSCDIQASFSEKKLLDTQFNRNTKRTGTSFQQNKTEKVLVWCLSLVRVLHTKASLEAGKKQGVFSV